MAMAALSAWPMVAAAEQASAPPDASITAPEAFAELPGLAEKIAASARTNRIFGDSETLVSAQAWDEPAAALCI